MIESFIACIATAIYFEARSEPLLGQIAVAHVIMNRVEDKNFPNDPCTVVTQSKTYSWNPDVPIRNKCQFSFYCDGVYHSRVSDPTDGSVYYHADYVAPVWASKKRYYRQIKTHIFYKEN
jgi:spore germination cell wall hydrolase CwlJ-like protein